MKKYDSFCSEDMIAPEMGKGVACHGLGNFENGWNFCMHRIRESSEATIKTDTTAKTIKILFKKVVMLPILTNIICQRKGDDEQRE
jgi:hypothetical protein